MSHVTQEQVKFWRDRPLDNLELLRATYITHTFAAHLHEGYAIGVVQRGAITTSFRHAHYHIPAGTIIVINPGELHTGEAASDQGWTYRMFYPRANLMQRLASELANRPRGLPFFPSPVIHDDYLAGLLLNLHITLEDQTRPQLERESLFRWAMAQLIARHADDIALMGQVKISRRSVKQIQEYIEAHYADDLSLPQLAALVHLTPCYMLRLFTKVMGMPPHAYLTQVRLKQAKRLLARGQPIADVAYQTGFTDQSHLTKRFKQMYGITPGQYSLSIN
jgi:AraC-like DNA-binding protein